MAEVTYTRVGPELEKAAVEGGYLYRTTTTNTTRHPISGVILTQQTVVTTTFVPGAAP